MRSPLRWIAASTFAAALALLACDEDEKLPPPRTTAGGTTGASMGSSGTTGGGGSAGGGAQPNLCECSASLGNGVCNDCFNAHTAMGTRCADQAAACVADGDCIAIRDCVEACADAACTQGCILPFDEDAAHALWRDVLVCVCGLCGADCSSSPPLECDEGAGGGGGAGGAGGTGGAGGG
jgi:uncharacterized membrane protein YgcG